ncbi:hypothetical protein MRX96_056770 [Rhipicephalus microplus]
MAADVGRPFTHFFLRGRRRVAAGGALGPWGVGVVSTGSRGLLNEAQPPLGHENASLRDRRAEGKVSVASSLDRAQWRISSRPSRVCARRQGYDDTALTHCRRAERQQGKGLRTRLVSAHCVWFVPPRTKRKQTTAAVDVTEGRERNAKWTYTPACGRESDDEATLTMAQIDVAALRISFCGASCSS